MNKLALLLFLSITALPALLNVNSMSAATPETQIQKCRRLSHGPTLPPPCCDPWGTGKTDCCPG